MSQNKNILKLTITIRKATAALSLLIVLMGNVAFGQSDVFKVTLDAGHGAHDFGAAYNGHVEKKHKLSYCA